MNFSYLTFIQIVEVLQTIFDILIVWFLLFYIIKVIRSNNRTMQIFKGIIFLFVVQAISRYLGFKTLSYIIDNILNWGFLALIIIFQPEIRNLLEKLGKSSIFNKINTLSGHEKEDLVQALIDATSNLAENKIGALITIEQSTSLSDYIVTGVQMNSLVSAELLCSLFSTSTTLHDGAVIIQGDRISCASAYLPTTSLDLPTRYGARHRAAIGISEITDSITIVVSEETGRVAIAEAGKLTQMNEKKLKSYLSRQILNKEIISAEANAPESSESVSIEELFHQETVNAQNEVKEIEKPNVAPGSKSVIIIEDDEDFSKETVAHKAEMKTFDKVDFKSTMTMPAIKDAKPNKEVITPSIAPIRQDKKSAIEKAVAQVAKEMHTTQQLRLEEIRKAEMEADRKLEEEKQKALAATKKVTLPETNRQTERLNIKPLEKVEIVNTVPKVSPVKITPVNIPVQNVRITEAPLVKPIEITRGAPSEKGMGDKHE